MQTIETLNQRLPVVTIVGTGLVGGSVGLGLKQAGYVGKVIGVGRRRSTLERALQRGCIDETAIDLPGVVPQSRLILLATPLGSFPALFEAIAPHTHEDLIISDAGSVKHSVCMAARSALPSVDRFVPAHPMAGAEQAGPEAARADLFRGRPCVLTPESETMPEAIDTVSLMWRLLGMTIVHMSVQEHDRYAAAISHLPHAAAVLLVAVAEELGGLDIASSGFHDTTRLASSHPTMRSDIMVANRTGLLTAIDAFQHRLDAMRQMLTRDDGASLLATLEEVKRYRDTWVAARHRAADETPDGTSIGP